MATPRTYDLIIRGAQIATIDPERRVLRDSTVAVIDGRIAEIVPDAELSGAQAETIIDARGKLLIPGLVNVHTHTQALLMRGGPSDLWTSTLEWLFRSLDPAMRAHTPADSRLAAQIYTLESIRAGTTTTVENCDYSFMGHIADQALRVYDELGIRIVWGDVFCDQMADNWTAPLGILNERYPQFARTEPPFPLQTLDEGLGRVEKRLEQTSARPSSRITISPAPIMPSTNSTEGLRRAQDLARKYNVPLLMHAGADTYGNVAGITDVQYLDGIGLLGKDLLLAHMPSVTPADIRLLKRTDTKIAWCPVITMEGEMPRAPVVEWLNAGVTVGIGTDDPNANQTANVLADLRIGALTQLQRYGAGSISPEEILEIATIGGARAIGMDSEIGSIETGKKADLVLIDLRRPNMVPTHNPASALVYQAHGAEVDTVIIDGELLLHEGTLTRLTAEEETRLYETAQQASYELLERAGMQDQRDRPWRSAD